MTKIATINNSKTLITSACIWLLISLPTFRFLADNFIIFENSYFYAVLYGILILGATMFGVGYYNLYSKLSTIRRASLATLMLITYIGVGYYLFVMFTVLSALLN